MSTTTTSRNARLATAVLVAMALLAASPIAAADEPDVEDDDVGTDDSCVGVDPYGPGVWADPMDCIPPSP